MVKAIATVIRGLFSQTYARDPGARIGANSAKGPLPICMIDSKNFSNVKMSDMASRRDIASVIVLRACVQRRFSQVHQRVGQRRLVINSSNTALRLKRSL